MLETGREEQQNEHTFETNAKKRDEEYCRFNESQRTSIPSSAVFWLYVPNAADWIGLRV